MEYLNIIENDIGIGKILPFIPIIIAFLIFNNTSHKNCLILIFTSLALGLQSDILNFISVAVISGYGGLCYWFSISKNKSKIQTRIITIIIFLLTIALMGHMIPNINNPIIINDHFVSHNANSFNKYLNIDKALAGLFLLLYVVPKPKKVSNANKVTGVLVTTTTIFIGLLLANLIGLVEIDPKIPTIILPWVITTLFFTCYAEEAFFRGFVQEKSVLLFKKYKAKNIIGIAISGIFFGLVHLAAGPAYVSIAILIGCSYSFIYYKTQNIYWPIAAHFAFNLVHFTLFTYPYIV